MVKVLEQDLKNIYFEGQEIKAVYFKEKKIFPIAHSIIGNEKLYSGYWNISEDDNPSIQTVKIEEEQNIYGQTIVHVIVNNSWYMDYEWQENSSEANPLNNITDNGGNPKDDYKLWWDANSNIWMWRGIATQYAGYTSKRYICRTENEAIQKKTVRI